MEGDRPDGLSDVRGREDPPDPWQRVHLGADQGRPPAFRGIGMGGDIQQHFIAWSAVHSEGDLVAHRPRWEEETGGLPEQVGHVILESVDGGVFAPLLIAHFGGGHRPAHRCTGFRRGVTVEVEAHGGRPVTGTGTSTLRVTVANARSASHASTGRIDAGAGRLPHIKPESVSSR